MVWASCCIWVKYGPGSGFALSHQARADHHRLVEGTARQERQLLRRSGGDPTFLGRIYMRLTPVLIGEDHVLGG